MRSISRFGLLVAGVLALGIFGMSGCKSASPIKTQAYAALKDQRDFEYEFPAVWKAIESVVKNYTVLERDPDEVDEIEMRKLTARKLTTDWIYTQSRDKFFEYKINDQPRKKYLQSRIKYFIEAKQKVGGIHVQVKTTEDIEVLKKDGTPDGYETMKTPDSSRAAEILDKIQNMLLVQTGQPGEPLSAGTPTP